MTYGEAIDVIKARQQKTIDDMRFRALLTYRMSELTATGVSISLGGKQQFPQLYEVFPGLFEQPVLKQQSWQVIKDRIAAYAEAKRKQKNGGEGR